MNQGECPWIASALMQAAGEMPEVALPAGHVESCVACQAAIEDARIVGAVLEADPLVPPADLASRAARVMAHAGQPGAAAPAQAAGASTRVPPPSPGALSPVVPLVLALSAVLVIVALSVRPSPPESLSLRPDLMYRPRRVPVASASPASWLSAWRELDNDGVKRALKAMRDQMQEGGTASDVAASVLGRSETDQGIEMPRMCAGEDLLIARDSSLDDAADDRQRIEQIIEEVQG